MIQSIYEIHIFKDPDFPLIFHFDTIKAAHPSFMLHWHENIEILFFVHGQSNVTCNAQIITTHAGDIVVINSNELHNIVAVSHSCKYYCLIIDKVFCESFNIPVSQILLQNLLTNNAPTSFFENIIKEMQLQNSYYKSAVKVLAIELLINLYRNFTITIPKESKNGNRRKIRLVKDVLSFLQIHYLEDITIDDICREMGFSKYYICHVFKEITRKTIIDYINCLRCDYAKILLTSGKWNVSESALFCGYHNLSYFSKCYKRYHGILPSEELHDI